MINENSQSVSTIPGMFLATLLTGLAMFFFPLILNRFFSLKWYIGDMQPWAYVLSALFSVLAILSWTARNRLNRKYAYLFPDPKHFYFTAIGITLSFGITLIALEGILHIYDFPLGSNWEPAEFRRAQFDPELGWSYIPNQSIEQQFIYQQPVIPVHTNAIGARVSSPDTILDQVKPTILLIGGSFTMGYGLPYEETFAGHLASIPEMPYQIVNLGVEAYGTDQTLLMLKRHFDTFDTRIVVYSFIGPHINRNHNYDRRLLHRGARFVGTKPLFAVRSDGSLYLKKPPITYEEYSYSRLWAIVELIWTRWGPIPDTALTEALMREMQTYVESQGATFIVVNWDWAYEGQRFRPAFFDEMKLNVIDTGENPPIGWSDWRLPQDSHPDERSTRHVAQLIFAELQRLNLVLDQ